MTEVLVPILCALISAASAVAAAYATASVSRSARRSEERAKRRAKESRLAMDLMYATCSLSLVTAKKMTGMHTNGDVEQAMEDAAQAREDYISFARDQAAQNFSKI